MMIVTKILLAMCVALAVGCDDVADECDGGEVRCESETTATRCVDGQFWPHVQECPIDHRCCTDYLGVDSCRPDCEDVGVD
jgi:hypothetical protein